MVCLDNDWHFPSILWRTEARWIEACFYSRQAKYTLQAVDILNTGGGEGTMLVGQPRAPSYGSGDLNVFFLFFFLQIKILFICLEM